MIGYGKPYTVFTNSTDRESGFLGITLQITVCKWAIHSPSVEDILDSIDIQQRYNISFWDSLVICSAQKLGCGVIWSEDLNHGQLYGEVIVRNPFHKESF
jgi:predicted nucleic acid-binding protein